MLINTKTQTQVWEYDFRASHPDTSFPQILSDEAIKPFGYAVLHSDVARPTPSLYQNIVTAPVQIIDGKYQEIWTIQDMTDEEITAVDRGIQIQIVNKTQERLDNFAKGRGYDNIMSACTYSGSNIEKFSIEGNYAMSIRDSTWDYLYKLLEDIKSGLKNKPTSFEDIENILPVLQWPN